MSRTLQFNLRIESQAQIDRWRAKAKANQRSLSDWIRLVLDRATLTEEPADQALGRLVRRRR